MMEKVVLLIEHSAEHIRCLLNPEQLEMRREAGLAARRSPGAQLSGTALSDDPLLYVGGGRTEFILDLLFDVSLAVQEPNTPALTDVRELTKPLWDLAENEDSRGRYGRPPIVYFLWGTSWNIRGIVAAASERLEHFSADGKPRRSWLRLRLLRVARNEQADVSEPSAPPVPIDEARRRLQDSETRMYQPIGDGAGGERPDQIAAQHLGHSAYWPLTAEMSGLDNPMQLVGKVLKVPVDPGIVRGASS